MENQATQPIETIGTHPHTRKTIGMETGATPKTVRSWIKKASVTGVQIQNVERFTDEQHEQILSFRAQPKAEAVIEAELIEPGAIELHAGESSQASPLVHFDIQTLQIAPISRDTSALDANTEQLKQVVADSANVIAQLAVNRFVSGVEEIFAEQDNMLQGIRAQALNGAAQSMQQGGK